MKKKYFFLKALPSKCIKNNHSHPSVITATSLWLIISLRRDIIVKSSGRKPHQPRDWQMSINQENKICLLLFFAPMIWSKTIIFCSTRINKLPVKWFYTQWITHVSLYDSQASSHFLATKWMKLQIHTFVHQKMHFTTFQ